MNLAKSLKIDCVARLQPTPPLQAAPTHTVAQAVTLLQQQRVGCLLICEHDRLVGLFTERDLSRRVLLNRLPLTLPLAECMTRSPVVVSPKDSLATALQLMQTGGYRHLPVVDDQHRPLGILSVKQVVRYLAEYFPATVYNLPPDPQTVPHEAEGA